MSGIYTHGAWVVIPGREDEFVAAWTDFARWTTKNVPGAGAGTLLRDREDRRRFVSFGPWESESAVAAWRQRPEFMDFVKAARELLEEFRPATLDTVALVAPGDA